MDEPISSIRGFVELGKGDVKLVEVLDCLRRATMVVGL